MVISQHCSFAAPPPVYTSTCYALSGDKFIVSVFSEEDEVMEFNVYRKISNIRRTLLSNKIVDHSDVDGASPVGAAPTTSSFST